MSSFTEQVSVKATLFFFISSAVADSFIQCHRRTDTRCLGIQNGQSTGSRGERNLKKKKIFVESKHSEEFPWSCQTNTEMSGS